MIIIELWFQYVPLNQMFIRQSILFYSQQPEKSGSLAVLA